MVWEPFLRAQKFHIETLNSISNANLKTKLKQKEKFAYANVLSHKVSSTSRGI